MNNSIYDVANLAGVSIATVSRVMNNKSPVSKEKEKRVLDAMAELNFEPNMNAKGLAENTTKIIGGLLPEFSDFSIPDSFILQFLNGLQTVLLEEGYNLMIINDKFEDDENKRPEYIKLIQGKRIDGLVTVLKTINGDIEDIIKNGFPLVSFGDNSEKTKGEKVKYSFYEYSSKVIDYLYNKGHREIGIIYYADKKNKLENKMEIIKSIYNERHINFQDNQMFINGAEDKENLYERIKKVLLARICTAFYVDSAYFAQQCIDACNELGLKIPQDISIVCLEYVANEAGWLHPKVTGFYVNSFELGNACGKLLLNKVNKDNSKYKGIAKAFEPVLTERNSVTQLN